MKDYTKIKWKYLSLLFFLLFIIFSGRLYLDSAHHEETFKGITSELCKDIKSNFISDKEFLVNKYSILAKTIMQNKKVSKLLEQKNTHELYKELQKSFQQLKLYDKNLHIMHFFDKNNVTVLRLHKPESFNDDLTLKRPIVSYVNKTLKQEHGFEVGKNGIVYRITTPYISNGKHLGVLEFGIKPAYFVDSLSKFYDVESQVLVKSKSLDVLTTKKEFNKTNEYSIISQTDFFKDAQSKISKLKHKQIVTLHDNYYVVLTKLKLNDYQNEDVAKILVAKDITKIIDENNLSMLIINIMTLCVLLVILLLLYIFFTKYVNEIITKTKTMNTLKKKSVFLEKKVHVDGLTKAYNKTFVNKYLLRFLKEKREGIILFLDIDHFKDCNDTHGHLVGDQILSKLSKTIQKNLRKNDLLVRWGGEEFIIIFENIDEKIALDKAEKIRVLIEQTEFVNNISITISIGVSKIKVGDELNDLLNRVDELLYTAKESGRNKISTDIKEN